MPRKMGKRGKSINKVLPPEMLKKILEFLDAKSLSFARQSCKRWKNIIDGFELVKQASSKFLEIFNYEKIESINYIFQKDILAYLLLEV